MKKALTENAHQNALGGKKLEMAWACKALLLFALCLQACQPSDDPQTSGDYTQGVLTINEGVFGNTSGTITHYDRATDEATPQIFRAANGRDLGDVVQSLTLSGSLAYIVVNNSNKIEVVKADDFTEVAQITGLRLPRYMAVAPNGDAYVTEWGTDGLTGTLARLDLGQDAVAERIPVSVGPEQLTIVGSRLFITHIGGFGTNNQVSVLDLNSRQIIQTITVGDRPSGMAVDVQGRLWVACAGKVTYTTYPNIDVANSTESSLMAIDPTTQQVVFRRDFGKGNAIGNLTLNTTDQRTLYYTREGQIWAYDTQNNTERSLVTGSYYGLGYDPNSQLLYAATSSGTNPALIQRLRPDDGMLVDAYTAGVFANSFVFQ